jgi:hypothetical protein
MKERDIERHLVERVKALGGEVRKVQWIGRRGAPDRLVMLPDGRHLWVELKAPGGRLEDHQAREHMRMLKMGQRTVVVDSLEGVDGVLG